MAKGTWLDALAPRLLGGDRTVPARPPVQTRLAKTPASARPTGADEIEAGSAGF